MRRMVGTLVGALVAALVFAAASIATTPIAYACEPAGATGPCLSSSQAFDLNQ